LTKGIRACPICPHCGSKKFKVIDNSGSTGGIKAKTAAHAVIVECLICAKKITI